MPSFNNSSLAIRFSPQFGFARTISTINCWSSSGIRCLPARDFHSQNNRNSLAMPADARRRFDHHKSRSPVKQVRPEDQPKPRCVCQPPASDLPVLVEGQLLANEQILRNQRRSRTKTRADERQSITRQANNANCRPYRPEEFHQLDY